MEIELAEELSDRSFFFFFLGVYLGLTALLTTVFMIMERTAGALQSLDVFTNHRPCVPWLSTMLLWRWWEIGYMFVFPLLKVLCDVKSSNSCDVEPFREALPHLSPILTERQRGRTSSSQQISWWGRGSGIGARLYNTYRYPLQMRKALGWYVRKAFSFVASQNIPSQSCTHLLRILLVMVVVLVIKEVAIWCFFQGLLNIPGCWIIATCKVWVLSRPSKLFLYFLCGPVSSIQAPLPLPLWSSSSFAFVKLLCLRLWTQGWVFWGHTGVQNWVCWAKLGSKLRLLGQTGV